MTPEIASYIDQYGYIALFFLVFLQEIGVPNPLANELVLLFAGYLTSLQQLDLMAVLITVVAADVLGTSLLYMLFYSCGQHLLRKWPRLMSTPQLTHLTTKIAHQHRWSIYLGRHLPFVRGYTSVAAGLLHIPPHIFLPAVVLSALTWSGGYVIAGRLFASHYSHAVSQFDIGSIALAALALLGLLAFLGSRLHHRLRRKSLNAP